MDVLDLHVTEFLAVADVVLLLSPEGRIEYANDRLHAALGAGDGELIGASWFDAAFDGPTREVARTEVRAFVESPEPPDACRDFEFPIAAVDGRRLYRWRTVRRWEGGVVTGILAHGTDITDQATANRHLRQNQQELTQLAVLAQAVSRQGDARQAVVDGLRDLTGASVAGLYEPTGEPGVLEMTASTDPQFVGRRVGGEHGPSGALAAFGSRAPVFVDEATSHPLIQQRLQQASGVRALLFQPIITDDLVVAVLAVGWPEPREALTARQATLVTIAAGEAASAIERVASRRQWEHDAFTDQLTGVWNRRAYERALADALAIAEQDGTPLAVGLLDLNGFKALNDSQGHAAGDAVLRDCAERWLGALRPTDLLARFGGDEFAVLLPGCTQADAELVAEKLRGAIRHAPGCGVGIAVWDGEEALSALLHRADSELYADKARQVDVRLKDPERLAAVRATGLTDGASDSALDEIATLVARLVNAPMSSVTLVTDDRQILAASVGISDHETPLSRSYCKHPATTGRELVVDDTTAHPLLAGNEATTLDGLRAYAGVPIEGAGGQIVGAVCAVDRVPRRWSAEQVGTLRLAAQLVGAILTERSRVG